MTKHEEFIEMLYARAKKIDDELDEVEVGSKEHVMGINDLAKIGSILNGNQQNETDRQDKEAKREEQQRVNEEELTIKKAQLINETDRLGMDRESRKNQIKQAYAEIGLNSLFRLLTFGTWRGCTITAMNEEFNLNGSHAVPIGVQRAIDRKLPPKI